MKSPETMTTKQLAVQMNTLRTRLHRDMAKHYDAGDKGIAKRDQMQRRWDALWSEYHARIKGGEPGPVT